MEPLQRYKTFLKSHCLERLDGRLDRHLQSALSVTLTERDDGAIPVGASKIGGAPDLPNAVAIPEVGGVAMPLFAQLNLWELATVEKSELLPKEGFLHFFLTSELDDLLTTPTKRSQLHQMTDNWKVVYSPEAVGELRRRSDVGSQWPASAIATKPFVCLPCYDSVLLKQFDLDDSGEVDETECYSDLTSNLDSSQDAESSRILGWSRGCQGDAAHDATRRLLQLSMPTKAPPGLIASAYRDTQLLLQIDTELPDSSIEQFLFFISQTELKKRNFSQVWLEPVLS